MSELIRRCFGGCAKALWIPAIAAPLAYVTTSFSNFSVFDLLLSISIGAAIGLVTIAVVGLPLLVALSYFQLNMVWLVSLIGLFLGVGYGASVPIPTTGVILSCGLIGAIAGGVASYYSRHHPSKTPKARP